jgi:peptidoglycan hydrolase-like protein with peptidoglycan-binding domain
VLFAISAAGTVHAQTRATLPVGSVFLVRTESPLQSAAAQVGQTFSTTVMQDVSVNGYDVIPANSRIRGVVGYVQRATRRQSGVMQVNFDRLTLPDGSSYVIAGKLTSTDSIERRQIDARADSRVVLVGERGGLGAAIAGAGSTTSSSASILSALGNLLSEGTEVDVPTGTTFAVQLERAITLNVRGSIDLADESTIFTDAMRIRAAQRALTTRVYYRGTPTGILDNSTRRALFEFQLDNNITATGNLDGRTATALGILNTSNVVGNASGSILSMREASIMRRAAQALAARQRADLGISAEGIINNTRVITDADVDVLFALSAFADNASLYEQFVRGSANTDAAYRAASALINSARRVDTALLSGRISPSAQNLWNSIRQQLNTLDANYR